MQPEGESRIIEFPRHRAMAWVDEVYFLKGGTGIESVIITDTVTGETIVFVNDRVVPLRSEPAV